MRGFLKLFSKKVNFRFPRGNAAWALKNFPESGHIRPRGKVVDGSLGFSAGKQGFDRRSEIFFRFGHGLLRWSFRHAEKDRLRLSEVTDQEGLWPQLKRIPEGKLGGQRKKNHRTVVKVPEIKPSPRKKKCPPSEETRLAGGGRFCVYLCVRARVRSCVCQARPWRRGCEHFHEPKPAKINPKPRKNSKRTQTNS